MDNNENTLKSLKSLLSNVILYLENMGAMTLSKTDEGIIVKENGGDNGYVYVKNEYLDLDKFDKLNLKTENAFFKQITPIDELFESLETLLSHYPSDKSIKYGIALEELKKDILKNQKSKSSKSKNKTSVPVPNLKGGKIVYQVIEKNERYILLKDYPINTKITYEEPMVNNLSSLWGGHKLHRNFVIIKAGLNGHNALCEFDIIGIKDNILCFFEIKNKCIGENLFLDRVYNASPYIVEWLTKNNYNIQYIAPIVYLREDVEHSLNKLNVIHYRDVLDNKPIVVDKLYALNKIGGFDTENPINKEYMLSKEIINNNENNDNDTNSNNGCNNLETQIYTNIMIKEEDYKKITNLVNNTDLFDSVDEFIDFAFKNAFNTIELLKK